MSTLLGLSEEIREHSGPDFSFRKEVQGWGDAQTISALLISNVRKQKVSISRQM
jgi:hypothetical protein